MNQTLLSAEADLRSRVSGPVLTAKDAGFAAEIAPFNTAVVHAPALVVAAATTNDVREAIRFARERGLPLAVQGSGHGAHTPIVGGVLISTRRLDRVEVDASTRSARIGGGAHWGPVITAAAAHGLAPIAGSSPTVGVLGYLLGGGLGPFARSHGFSSDYLLEATLVTGAGEVLEVSAGHRPDLLWALRGGKGGLGIVTEVRLRLVALPQLYAGALFFAEADIERVLRTWIDWTGEAHPQVTTSAAIMRFPPFDFIPDPLRGRRLLSLRFAYPGTTEEGVRLAAPLRAAAPVYLDALSALPLAEVAQIHGDPTNPGPSAACGLLLDEIDQEFATRLLAQVGAGTDPPFIAVEVRHLGEATTRDVEGGSAVGGRGARFTLAMIGVNPSDFASVLPAATKRVTDAVRPYLAAETNINFAGQPHSEDDLTRAWRPATHARLRSLRQRHDPQNLFRYGSPQ